MNNIFKNNKWAVWTIVVSVLAIAVFAFFLFGNFGGNKVGSKVLLKIEAPQQVSSGNNIVYRIKVQNDEDIAIKNVTLDLIYPQGFTFEESSPKSNRINGTQFNIPDLAPSQNAVLMIKGTINGNAGETKEISGVMRYQFVNFNSNFVAQAKAQTEIINSKVVLQFDGQLQANNDQTLTYVLSYYNSTEEELKDLRVRLTLPDRFNVVQYQPQPSQDISTAWYLPPLAARAKGQISITGKFNGVAVGDQKIFAAEIQQPDQQSRNVTLSNATYTVTIGSVPLSVDLSAKNQTTTNQSAGTVQPGDTLSYKVRYKNNSRTALNGVVVKLTLEGQAFDLSSIRAQRANISGNSISWDASQVEDLETLNPNDEGDLLVLVSIKNPATRSNVKDLTITARAEIRSDEFQESFASETQNLKVQTVAQIERNMAYSTGSNPLKVGESTTYIVVVGLRNASSDIKDGVVTFNLPNTTGFDKSAINFDELQNVTFDQNTKKVTWNVGTLQAHTGTFSEMRKLQFTVTIRPGLTDVGKAMLLVNNLKFSGVDTFTAVGVSITGRDLTTAGETGGTVSK